MSIFRKRTQAEEFGASLRQTHAHVLQQSLVLLKRPNEMGVELRWSESLDQELEALICFAFYLAIHSGSERALRERIWDGFLAATPRPAPFLALYAQREREYSAAMDSCDPKDWNFQIGLLAALFARHIGQVDPYGVLMAGSQFYTAHSLVQEQIRVEMRNLR